MTDEEKEIIEKQIKKAQSAINKADCEVSKISVLLHKFGYLYNAEETSNEIIFVPCDENFDTLNAMDEHYNLDSLIKGKMND